MLETTVNPSVSNALDFINCNHVSMPDKTVLLVAGDCMVDYRGRARSFLDWGERLVIIKQDGNVLVHQPVMREPINWQPAGTNTNFKVEENNLVMRCNHTKPPEKMKVTFRKIKFVTVTKLVDRAEQIVSGMEADVVNNIIEKPECVEEGLRIKNREKQVKSGMIDLFGYDQDHNPVIIEVKRSIANISAVHQLRMYVDDIKGENEEAEVRGILCAPHIPDLVKHLLDDYGLEWQEVERKVVIPDDFQKTLKDF
ncbi:MAG: endonuclease NucS [Candidatus Thermoplasmatota archaeon]